MIQGFPISELNSEELDYIINYRKKHYPEFDNASPDILNYEYITNQCLLHHNHNTINIVSREEFRKAIGMKSLIKPILAYY